MNIGFHFREALRQLSIWLEEEFDRLFAGLQAWSRVEHNDDGTHSEITATSVTTTTLTTTTATVSALTATSGQVSLGSTGISISTGAGLTPLAAHGYKFTGVSAAALSGLYAGTTGTTNKVMIHNDVETNGWTALVELLVRDNDNHEVNLLLSADDSNPSAALEVDGGSRETGVGVDEAGGVKVYWDQATRNDVTVNADGVQVIGLQAAGDRGGKASTVEVTNVSDVTANSTGVGSIKFKGTTSRDSVGFVKVYIGTTAYYVPVFDAITG